MQRRNLIQAAAGAGALLAAPMIKAQTLPNGPVRIVVGFPPGGGTDILARLVGLKLADLWKLPVVVENRAGAAGVIAADFVSKQPADGNTLIMAHINSHALAVALKLKLAYDPLTSFTPLSLVGITPNLLVCNADQPAKTVKDVIALCQSKPGRISFASAGSGSAQHFALELFKLRAKVFALHIPYRGSAPALTDLIGGQVNYCFETMTSATPHVKSGKAIAIAQTRLKRAKGHPSVPTVAESGLPGFEATTWYGLMGAGKLPPAMAQRMNDDINRVLAMPDVQERLDFYGAEDGGGSMDKFARFIESEQRQWASVATLNAVKADS